MFAGGALQHQVSHELRVGSLSAWVGGIPSVAAMVATDGPGDCHSADSLHEWLERFARQVGFSAGRYVHLGHQIQLRGVAERPPLRFLSTLGEANDPWRAGDPAAPKITVSFIPFDWSTRDDLDLPDRQRAWLSVERLRGVEAGIAIPVQDYLSGPAYLSLLGGSQATAASVVRLEAHQLIYLAVEFHCRAKAILPAGNGDTIPLTDREISCLRHAASGASVPQTASSLGIATRTVELYFARAARKLGASNKIQAVALALTAGLIQI